MSQFKFNDDPIIIKGEHPEDAKTRLAGCVDARWAIDSFFEEHKMCLAELLVTYADDDAVKILRFLREEFWTSTTERANAAFLAENFPDESAGPIGGGR
jgi:hypothetical protein